MNTRANQTLKEAENPILSLEDLSIDEEQGQVENVTNKKCPICKRDQKNVLLHIKKNSQCKAQISEEQLQVLKDQSKAVRQKKVRISVAKCMRRAREKNEEMVKGLCPYYIISYNKQGSFQMIIEDYNKGPRVVRKDYVL